MSLVLPRANIANLSQAQSPEEFKKVLRSTMGDLADVEVMFNMVLLGTFIRPEKTAGGVYRPTDSVTEDVWQGKAGLVLKLGPNAFESDDETDFKGQRVEPGEWVVFKVGDAWQLTLKGVPCRLVRDSSIRMKLKDPNVVF